MVRILQPESLWGIFNHNDPNNMDSLVGHAFMPGVRWKSRHKLGNCGQLTLESNPLEELKPAFFLTTGLLAPRSCKMFSSSKISINISEKKTLIDCIQDNIIRSNLCKDIVKNDITHLQNHQEHTEIQPTKYVHVVHSVPSPGIQVERCCWPKRQHIDWLYLWWKGISE